ncbi:hypothetical protein [Escherichia coli]|uniref:hypothetical protein n=1 Tax=Escherichia coli TaxID=562 RepID=UPI000FEFD462|nr:hypothetical protein [Escherichia coli]ROK80445.1 hypothetical protein BFD58_26390 [Escherichia coli]
MNPRLTLTEHQRRAEAVNNVLEDIIRLYRGELSVCRAAFHFQGIQKQFDTSVFAEGITYALDRIRSEQKLSGNTKAV